MTLAPHIVQTYKDILREELLPAMGCTEPIAIAYAASILCDALGGEPTAIRIGLSGNIIKNVKSVIVPAAGGLHGIEAAVAAGVIARAPHRRLEVLCALDAVGHERIRGYMESTPIAVRELDTRHPFELDLEGEWEGHTARVRVIHRHTNVVLVGRDGENITAHYVRDEGEDDANRADRSLLNVADIVTFADARWRWTSSALSCIGRLN